MLNLFCQSAKSTMKFWVHQAMGCHVPKFSLLGELEFGANLIPLHSMPLCVFLVTLSVVLLSVSPPDCQCLFSLRWWAHPPT